MNPSHRAALRGLVQRLLPVLGREGLLDAAFGRLARQLSAQGHQPGHDPAPGPDRWFDDPALATLWTRPETLGWVHQYAQEEAKDQAYARLLKQGQKVPAGALPAVTQLFTPAWIVRFLVENSLGRLWLNMHPDSALRSAWSTLLPAAQPAEPPAISLAAQIRVFDPACGAMHFGLAAFDLLAQCYEEELARAGTPGWPERPSVASPADIGAAILTRNLYGADIDPAVLDVARRALRLKGGAEPAHLYHLPAPLGSLVETEVLPGPFHVVLTNPPYLARKNTEPALGAYLEAHFPEGKGDLYTAFLQRCLRWLAPGGRVAMISQASFLFLGSYAPLRRWLLQLVAVEAVAHLGTGAFVELVGEKVNTAAFVLRREDAPERRLVASGLYLRLVEGGEEEKAAALTAAPGDRLYRLGQATLTEPPGMPWLYWLPDGLREAFAQSERLGDRARFCRGITTADNGRFLRYWWEVGLGAVELDCLSAADAARSDRRWFPYQKGGAPLRWFGNLHHVIDWSAGGEALRRSPRAAVRNLSFQFRQGVTYSSVTGGALTARLMEPGFLFDQAANALFPHDEADGPLLLALLNHPIAAFTAGFNPTVNIVAADLNRIPWPRADRAAVATQVGACVELARALDQASLLSPRFRQPPPPDLRAHRALLDRLAGHEAALERLLDEALGLTPDVAGAILASRRPVAPAPPTPAALTESWVTYALLILLGQCRPDGPGSPSWGCGPLLAAHWPAVAPLCRPGRLLAAEAPALIQQLLLTLLGEEGAHGVIPTGGLAAYLSGPFAARHARTFRQRPVLLRTADPDRWTLAPANA